MHQVDAAFHVDLAQLLRFSLEGQAVSMGGAAVGNFRGRDEGVSRNVHQARQFTRLQVQTERQRGFTTAGFIRRAGVVDTEVKDQ